MSSPDKAIKLPFVLWTCQNTSSPQVIGSILYTRDEDAFFLLIVFFCFSFFLTLSPLTILDFFSLNLISCIHFIATICPYSSFHFCPADSENSTFNIFILSLFAIFFFYEHSHSFLLHSSTHFFFFSLLFHIVSLLYRHTTLERPVQLNFELHNL